MFESGTKNKAIVLRQGGGGVFFDEGSSISQQIRGPCKCQLALTPPWGMGWTIRIRTSLAYVQDWSDLCVAENGLLG